MEPITFTTAEGVEIHFETEWERDDAVDAYYSPMYCQESTERLITYLEMNQVGFWVQHPYYEQVYYFKEK